MSQRKRVMLHSLLCVQFQVAQTGFNPGTVFHKVGLLPWYLVPILRTASTLAQPLPPSSAAPAIPTLMISPWPRFSELRFRQPLGPLHSCLGVRGKQPRANLLFC